MITNLFQINWECLMSNLDALEAFYHATKPWTTQKNHITRIMFDLPLSTHWYFVQPVTTKMHLKNLSMKRFLSFLSQFQKSSKLLPGLLLNLVKHDVRSTTGSNLRNVMLLTGKNNIEQVKKLDVADIDYAPDIQEDLWKIQMVWTLLMWEMVNFS